MQTWYILDTSDDYVWYRPGNNPGCFAVDIDGLYEPERFGYKHLNTAKARYHDVVARANRGDFIRRNGSTVHLVSREELFRRKGIPDPMPWLDQQEDSTKLRRKAKQAELAKQRAEQRELARNAKVHQARIALVPSQGAAIAPAVF